MSEEKIKSVRKFLENLYPSDEKFVMEQLAFFRNNLVETETIEEFTNSIREEIKGLTWIKDEFLQNATERIFNYLSNPLQPSVNAVFVYNGIVYLYDVDDWTKVIERTVEETCETEWFLN